MAEQTPDAQHRKRDLLSVLGMVAVAGAAAFTSYSGLDGLAQLAGWPGKLAMLLPVTIDAYAMTATRVWLSPARLTKKARAWARNNAIGAISMSVLGNTIYHAAAAHVLTVTWPVVVGISAIPSIVLGLTVHLWHVADDLEPEPAPKQSPGPAIAEPEQVRAAYPILGNANGASTRAHPPAVAPVAAANGNRTANPQASTPKTGSAPVSGAAVPGVSGTVSGSGQQAPANGSTGVSGGQPSVPPNPPQPVSPRIPAQSSPAAPAARRAPAGSLPPGRTLTPQQVAARIRATGGTAPGVREVMRTYGLGYAKAAEALTLAENTGP